MLLLALSACLHAAPPSMAPTEVLAYRTADGWQNDLRHYPADGPPLLLVHGLGANHYNWDFRPEISPIPALRDAGFDVWVVALRGDPGSVAPSRAAARSVDFDGYAAEDLPAAVDRVLAATGAEELYWVGHSMGGMLLYTALATYPDKIAAGVAIASPATLETQTGLFRSVAALRWALGGKGDMPAIAAARLARPLGRHNPLFARLANTDNLDWSVAFGVARYGLIDVPRPLARQAVGWIDARRITRVDGSDWLANAAASDVPLLALGGAGDRLVPAADVAAACALFAPCTYRELGVGGGFSLDYGHVDPVIGLSAPAEVYPAVIDFLVARRAEAALTAP